MKKLVLNTVILALVTIGCNKNEQEITPKASDILSETVSALINQEMVTKTNYAIEDSKATFTWSEGDQFGRICRESNYSTCLYTAETGIDGKTSGTFIGTASPGALSYAIYPVSADNGANVTVSSGSSFVLTLPASIAYNHSAPLKNIVPMMGKLTEGAYEFKPICGVIGFHASNVPSTATSITLSVNSADKKGLSGSSAVLTSYSLDDTGNTQMGEQLRSQNGMARGWMANNNTGVTLTFSAGSFSEGDFYFPVPPTFTTGKASGATSLPLEGLLIEVKNAGGDVLARASTSANIAVNRAELVLLPNITFPSTEVSVTLTGAPSDVKAYISSSQGCFDKVCIAPITSNTDEALNAAIGNNTQGTDITGATSESPITVSGFTSSGRYYIGVKAFSGESEVYSVTLDTPVYYLTATDKEKLVKTHTLGYATTGDLVSGMKYGTTIFKESDDCTKGQLILADFDGMTSVASENRFIDDAHPFFKVMGTWFVTDTYAYDSGKVKNGETMYGKLADGYLDFDATKAFFKYSYTDGKTADIFLFSAYKGHHNVINRLRFQVADSKLTCPTETDGYITVRFVGDYTGGNGFASKDYATNMYIDL